MSNAKEMINRVVSGDDASTVVGNPVTEADSFKELGNRAKAAEKKLLALIKFVSGKKTWSMTPMQKEMIAFIDATDKVDNALVAIQQKARTSL